MASFGSSAPAQASAGRVDGRNYLLVFGLVISLFFLWGVANNLNDILIRMGWMTERVAWLSSPVLAMPAVILTNVWRGVPFFAIMLLAGLQAIPTELYEAARVDGASVTQRFWQITVPMLRPIIVVATATRIVWTFNYADLIFVMTSGGPANATQITSTYTLMQAYSNLDFGYAATLSVALLLIMLGFTIFYLRITRGLESTT
jgi:multiple sugar transport system permease protein